MQIPVGTRFYPTDRQLCSHYLKHKNAGNDSRVDNGIGVVNICAHEPWELPALSKMNAENDHAWFFFTLLHPKYLKRQTTSIARNRSRKLTRENRETPMNRSTKEGSWRPTGKDRVIKANGRVIGTKKTLVFYRRGPGRGHRTNWIMHQYRAASISPIGRNYVICKVKHKQCDNAYSSSSEIGQSSHSFASDSVSLPSSPNIIPEVNNQMQGDTAESLKSFGRLDDRVDSPYVPNIDFVQPELTVDENGTDSLITNPEFEAGFRAEPDSFISQNLRDYAVGKMKYKNGGIALAPSSEIGQSSHSFASDFVNLVPSSNITPEVNNQMQVTAAESLNLFVGSDSPIVDRSYWHDIGIVQPESTVDDDMINSLIADPDAEVIAEPDGYTIEKSVPHTDCYCYKQPQPISGEYTDSSSDADSETTEEQSFEEIASPIGSLCSSEGSNEYEVDIEKTDYSTEPSAMTGQFSGDTMAKENEYKAKDAAEPREATDQSKESSTELSSKSTQFVHGCTEGTEDKVKEAAQAKTMKLKSLVIHLLILIISIVGFKKLLWAKKIHGHNL